MLEQSEAGTLGITNAKYDKKESLHRKAGSHFKSQRRTTIARK